MQVQGQKQPPSLEQVFRLTLSFFSCILLKEKIFAEGNEQILHSNPCLIATERIVGSSPRTTKAVKNYD